VTVGAGSEGLNDLLHASAVGVDAHLAQSTRRSAVARRLGCRDLPGAFRRPADVGEGPTEPGGAVEEPRGRLESFRVVEERRLRQEFLEVSANREFRAIGLLKEVLEPSIQRIVNCQDCASIPGH
jgi:hypothetical protein